MTTETKKCNANLNFHLIFFIFLVLLSEVLLVYTTYKLTKSNQSDTNCLSCTESEIWKVINNERFSGKIKETVEKSLREIKNNQELSLNPKANSDSIFIRSRRSTVEELNPNSILGLESPQGPPGPPGPPGPRGLQGEKGDYGIPGEDGIPGLPGEKGDFGVGGLPGYPGTIGLPGPKGEKGDHGPQGYQGLIGPKGDRGFPGLFGGKGDLGEVGLPGFPGIIGPKGDRGFDGSPGQPGQAGGYGSRGYPGTIGLPGPKGNRGNKGHQGAVGKQGLKGDTGEIGPKGEPGQPAYPALRGLPGNSMQEIFDIRMNQYGNGFYNDLLPNKIDNIIIKNVSEVKTDTVYNNRIAMSELSLNKNTGVLWEARETNTDTLLEFQNILGFKNSENYRTYELYQNFDQGKKLIYNKHFYYKSAGRRPAIIRYSLENDAVQALGIPGITSKNLTPLYKFGFTYFDFNVDENGLWVIFAVPNNNNTGILKINTTDGMTIENAWKISIDHTKFNAMFIASRKLYTLELSDNLKISYAFDLYRREYFTNIINFDYKMGATSSYIRAWYNHINEKLYVISSKTKSEPEEEHVQYEYLILFEKTTSSKLQAMKLFN